MQICAYSPKKWKIEFQIHRWVFDTRWQQYTLEILDSQPAKVNFTQGIECRRIPEIIFRLDFG